MSPLPERRRPARPLGVKAKPARKPRKPRSAQQLEPGDTATEPDKPARKPRKTSKKATE